MDVSTSVLDLCSGVPDTTVVEPPVGEMTGGADETKTCTGRSVLGCVAPRDGVESDDVPSEVEGYRRCVALGSSVKLWVPLEPVELEPPNGRVMCWSVVSPTSALRV